MKTCKKCHKELPLEMFKKSKVNDDGLTNWCLDCCEVFKTSSRGIYRLTGDKKVCSSCKIKKDKDEFYTNHERLDGLSSSCKSCYNGRRKVMLGATTKREKDWIGGDSIYCA